MRLLLVISLTSTLFSCTKFGRTDTAKGRVLNSITGEGIPNVEMKLLKTTSGIPGGNKAVKSTTTEADGSYEISKTGLKSYSLSCNLSADYYPIGWYVDGEIKNTNTGNYSLKKGKTLHADFYAAPYGCVSWHIKNVNCEGTTDSMWYRIKYQYDSDFLNLWSLPIVSCADITSTGCDKMPMGNHILYIKVKRPSGTVYYYDTIFVNEIGTTNVDLFY